jgi:hypothetical protein
MTMKGQVMNTDPSGSSIGRPSRWRSRLVMLLAGMAAVTGLAVFPALTANASPAPARPGAVAARIAPDTPPPPPGNYAIYYSWGCTSSYLKAGITFNSNGTFNDSQGGAGTWGLVNGSMFWEYNSPSRTMYSGTIDGYAGSGASSTFSTGSGSGLSNGGATGCWYMVASSSTDAIQRTAHHGQLLSPAGASER